MIEPRTLKGFRDYLPESMIPRCRLVETASRVYRSFGFAPIDTPCLEYLDILLGKGGDETDKQLYHFQDHGGRNVGLRFDLTVPLARYVAQHSAELGMPFKRYHIAPVWRGENTQTGRYREFMQCDFDTIGTLDISADIESTLVIYTLLREIGFSDFTIHLNNRKLLTGLLEKNGLVDRTLPVLRAVDKIAKIGRDAVSAELQAQAGLSVEQGNQLLDLMTVEGDNATVLGSLANIAQGNELAEQGVFEMETIYRNIMTLGVPERNVRLNASIVRGLDYYTGTIWETFLGELPTIGSVCSGGRFDNLAGLFTKEKLPGIGASLGLDRLLAAMEQLGMTGTSSTPATVLVLSLEAECLTEYLRLAQRLRAAGLCVEVYPECKKMKAQLKYASRKGFRYAVIAGAGELSAGVCQVKDLMAQEQVELSLDEVVSYLEARAK